ncbi:hypothetical protein [Dactylosporangium sp. CA-139066]|uniref:hypothetical protein n=1 Tax=Dactylosporangium sp. CA-139066 TaxID=3239930 RepID=UPI003D92F355
MQSDVLVRAALLGASAGARSATPLAAVAAPRGGWLRGLTGAAALAELVVDKLPRTPSRLAPGPLAGRVVSGALAGGAYARRRKAGLVAPVLVAAAAALVASHAGARWRAAAARRSLAGPAAVIEDSAAVALAWAGAGGDASTPQ